MWEKVSPKATDEGCSRERQRLTPLEHPSSVLPLCGNPPSPTRGEGEGAPCRFYSGFPVSAERCCKACWKRVAPPLIRARNRRR
ncbi:hypothetical protein EJ070_10970 [Mesorhizobium sp. M1E.F.Ca.ET.045.02.1.1]|nr:hypothetical protein EJ070_10970 [Mesorhizobium sp. M1E.F.Ca.ET.045.02.1.1]RUW83617.1 hypothetical protein EOA29_12680 [Mesorhizobium sp. M1E.F.Ca.ET.063.01.1.1]